MDGNPSSGQPTMASWLDKMPLNGNSVATQCYGTKLSQPDWDGYDYCDAALAGKTYA